MVKALVQAKRVGEAQTYSQIVDDYAPREDIRNGRIDPNVLPPAHHGVVLLRQLKRNVGRGRAI